MIKESKKTKKPDAVEKQLEISKEIFKKELEQILIESKDFLILVNWNYKGNGVLEINKFLSEDNFIINGLINENVIFCFKSIKNFLAKFLVENPESKTGTELIKKISKVLKDFRIENTTTETGLVEIKSLVPYQSPEEIKEEVDEEDEEEEDPEKRTYNSSDYELNEKIINSVIGVVPRTSNVLEFKGIAEYTTIVTNPITKKIEDLNRKFVLEYREVKNEYQIKISNEWMTKKDMLNLYHAFRTTVRKKIDTYLKNKNSHINKENEEELDKQISIFGDSFKSVSLQDMFMTLMFLSDSKNKWVVLKFFVTFHQDNYGLKLNDFNYLTLQDIYFVYHNFDRLIRQFLNRN